MKTIKIYLAFCLVLCLGLSGCDLTAINENPNKPTDNVDYNLNDPLLASLLRDAYIMEGDNEQRIKSLMLDFYAQMLIDRGDWDTKNYRMNEEWNVRMWEHGQRVLSSCNIVIRNLSGDDTYVNAIALAKIWRVFVQSRNVDYFGPCPFPTYKEVEDNPPYKSVEDNYKEFFQELDEALEMFDETHPNGIFNESSYDIVYKGDISKWKKFANSLRLRLAMHLSEVAPDITKTQAEIAIANGVMESSNENAYLPPKADGGWGVDYNYTMFQITWGGSLNMSSTFEKLVTNLGGQEWPAGVVNKTPTISGGAPIPVSSVHPDKVDPRGPIMFQPALANGDWKGIPFGVSKEESNKGIYQGTLYAELGILVKDGSLYRARPYDVFLYEEVCFLKAEAILRGFISGDAQTEYENGVRASLETWGVGVQFADYIESTEKNLAGTSVKFTDQDGPGNTALEKIITQKYIAAVPDIAFEAWNDKRRLNLPRMDVGLSRDENHYDNSNRNVKDPKNFIRRVQYPNKEAAINLENYQKGVQLLGGNDNVATPIWWDKLSNYCTSAE